MATPPDARNERRDADSVAGTQRGLGRSDLKNLKIEEINVSA